MKPSDPSLLSWGVFFPLAGRIWAEYAGYVPAWTAFPPLSFLLLLLGGCFLMQIVSLFWGIAEMFSHLEEGATAVFLSLLFLLPLPLLMMCSSS